MNDQPSMTIIRHRPVVAYKDRPNSGSRYWYSKFAYKDEHKARQIARVKAEELRHKGRSHVIPSSEPVLCEL